MQLHYIFDPLCGWCYGAARLVHALAAELAANWADAAPLQLWPGALFPEPVQVAPVMRAHITQADRRIAGLTGATFGAAYLARIGNPAQAVTLWSVPPIAALAACPRERQLELLEALQRAHYLEGRDLADAAVLAELTAAHGGSDAAAQLASPANAQAANAWIGAARQLMARAGVGGFPGFVLEREGRLQLLDHQPGYADPENFIEHIRSLR